MEVAEVRSSNPQPAVHGGGGYTLPAVRFSNEDILFCIDIGRETLAEMKLNGPNGRPYTRLDSISRQLCYSSTPSSPSIPITVSHSPPSANPPIGKLEASPISLECAKFCDMVYVVEWHGCHVDENHASFLVVVVNVILLRKEFSSEVDAALSALRGLSVDSSTSHADLTQLFKVATHEAKKSRAQNRIFRVILIYCRSSTPPKSQLPSTLKLFTLDVMYLHDKPGPDNCPQVVYDTLVDALERISEFEGYIFESGQGLTRALFRNMCQLLCHPQQRCIQDELDLPKSLVKKSPAADASQGG
ncbi:hypothetical protein SASPL_150885 [Salvia splendens]|uniref:BRISC and BRCA1-A complex member 1 n=1 Tax=Salvia splendens TaxID=180675 RepID=A0A8X8Z385_SALSN|nr:hypothetical protein SASPL_150885 [Salvia splendens]